MNLQLPLPLDRLEDHRLFCRCPRCSLLSQDLISLDLGREVLLLGPLAWEGDLLAREYLAEFYLEALRSLPLCLPPPPPLPRSFSRDGYPELHRVSPRRSRRKRYLVRYSRRFRRRSNDAKL